MRLKRWLNQAYRELCDEGAWPFLEESYTDTAPFTIKDLGHVLSVVNPTTDSVIPFIDRRRVVAGDPTINETGGACYWYREGENTIKVWPADTTTKFIVRYMKAPAELSAQSDEPIVPKPYQELIVLATAVRLLADKNDYEAAQFERQEWERGIKRMQRAFKPNYDRNRSIVRTGAAADYMG